MEKKRHNGVRDQKRTREGGVRKRSCAGGGEVSDYLVGFGASGHSCGKILGGN